ncbi:MULTISPECIES: heme ABC transporter ATP-binding protein [Salinibaculum]|uniref:heme ABC transporter ATP-binding protein n=1 Tax=Salinibaculum TaxID=2732368 RepID=UPI0030CC0148
MRADGVTVSFGDVTVLDGVDLAVETGELVGLVGPNGAGKTTLLRTINGVLAPDAGDVRLAGDRVTDLSSKAVSRRVATVPQDTQVGFAFTAEQVVEMGRTPHRSRLDWTDDEEPVAAAMERTETLELRERRIDGLSGGERQRVLLARALAQDTPALVLDEPTASLDINHQVRVLETVRDLVDDRRAALAAIHDLDLAARYCDRLLLLYDGRIRASGTPDEVLDDPALEDAFGTRTAVSHNPATGTATVAAVSEESAARDERVHVVGGGPLAARAVGELWRAGFDVTLGVVGEGDVAADTAARLGVDATTAPPFEAPPPAVRADAISTIESADVVVTTGGPGSSVVAPAVAAHDRVVAVGTDDPATVSPSAVPDAIEETLATQQAAGDD